MMNRGQTDDAPEGVVAIGALDEVVMVTEEGGVVAVVVEVAVGTGTNE